MALFFTKKGVEQKLTAAREDATNQIAEKDQELEKLREVMASAESGFREQIAVLEEELQKRQNTIAASAAAFEEEKEKMRQAHVDEIVAVRRENAIQTQQMIEFIDARKEELAKKTDKELLVSAVMALEGYAGRLERVEKNMEYHEVTERMAEMKKEFNENLDSTEAALLEKLERKEVTEKISQLQESTIGQLEEMQKGFSWQMEQTKEDLSGKIVSMNTGLTELMNSLQLPERLETLSGQIDDLYRKFSGKVDELARTITEKIGAYDTISARMASLQETVSGMGGTVKGVDETANKTLKMLDKSGLLDVNHFGKNDVIQTLGELKSDMSHLQELRNSVNEIKGDVRNALNSDAVSSRLNSIEQAIQGLNNGVDAVRKAAEQAEANAVRKAAEEASEQPS